MNSNFPADEKVAAIIGILLVLGSLIITIMEIATHGSFTYPEWLLSATTLVIGYYFGRHSKSGGN